MSSKSCYTRRDILQPLSPDSLNLQPRYIVSCPPVDLGSHNIPDFEALFLLPMSQLTKKTGKNNIPNMRALKKNLLC